jgi:hypothetical protein
VTAATRASEGRNLIVGVSYSELWVWSVAFNLFIIILPLLHRLAWAPHRMLSKG